MQNDIVFVDYELSSWKYMDDSPYVPSKYAKYICGAEPLPVGSNLIIKSGYVESEEIKLYNNYIQKGMGSAFGGQWKPSKPEDERFWGKPGEIKTTYKNGYRVDTKIGEDGRAIKERHYTDKPNPKYHTNPHDHDINRNEDRGNPLPGPPINYPNGAPEFKSFREMVVLDKNDVRANSLDENKFKTINEFKWCINDGGEVAFIWGGKEYGVFKHNNNKFIISEINNDISEKCCNTADDVLEYMVGKDRLRNVITQVTVTYRTI